ncbi:glycine cleavage system aminomethyltransferase GcvT [Wenxinia saemankumensis]|uniref:aminomethyltransferase n=1 Tax=Wenxinia saemankumensis TaxID=1447782 RepID=A0A1M6GA49_9RHOB|nr:glycine cleavage system aminomethyltransferase GcvT [Wenxinia saemankumensis]SHJ06840.1 aminomethyltransferase [Wenxinia saemankumensis]
MSELARTPLYDLHVELGARMVPFAGWEMPVQYAPGVMKEHLHTRAEAGLFDVSHMGQVILRGPGAAEALEALVPADIVGLRDGRQRYALLTDETGGILDDLMVANRGDHLFLVVNAANAAADIAHLRADTPPDIEVEVLDRALIALQGPAAEEALDALAPGAAAMRFMDVATLNWDGTEIWVSRSGYTGEDGFEISVEPARAEALARALLAHENVAPVGLGARDSLRLEAGLCLHGHDISTATTPVDAALTWAIQKVRRPGGARAGGYPGADAIERQLAEGAVMTRVGLRPEGRSPMREGVELFDAEDGTAAVGRITSGGFGPTLQAPVAMGYVETRLAQPGTRLWGELRGRRLPVAIAPLPFVPATFKR